MFLLQVDLISENLSVFLNNILGVVPKIMGALIFFALGWIFAKYIKKLLIKLFIAIKVDTLSAAINKIDLIHKSKFEFKLSVWLASIIYYFILLVVIIGATDILGVNSLSNLLQDILKWIPNLVTAIAIMAIGLLFADFLRGIVYTATNSMGIPSARIISLFIFYFVLITVVVSAMSQAQIDTVFISSNLSIVIGGVVGAFALSYGLASKEVIANFLGAQYSQDVVKVGDQIHFQEHEGTLIQIDKSVAILRTSDEEIVIPLHLFLKNKIIIKK